MAQRSTSGTATVPMNEDLRTRLTARAAEIDKPVNDCIEEAIEQWLEHRHSVESVAISPDGKWLATCGDFIVRIWDALTGRERTRIGQGYIITSAAISPDGKWLASASAGGPVRIWDVATGSLLRTGPSASANEIGISPDGKWLATADYPNHVVRIWDVSTARELARLEHQRVHSLAISPDSKWLATVSWGGTACIWDAEAKRERTRIPIRIGGRILFGAGQMVVSADGKLLVDAFSNRVRILDVSTGVEPIRWQRMILIMTPCMFRRAVG